MRDSNGILVEELVLKYKNGPLAVDHINLEVAPGEIYGFLGPNGAGKSTAVLVMTTLLPPTGGRATVAGFDVQKQGAQVRRSIGAALQAVALDNFLTGREHIHMVGQLHGMTKKQAASRADVLLKNVGLTQAADRRVGGYSGGMKRRLDLALALVHTPKVLFLDEPTTGLDPQSRAALWDDVSNLSREEGVTVFLTTQYLEEADVLADRVGIIDHGKIVAEGTPAELKASIGAPTVEAVPIDAADEERLRDALRPFGDSMPGHAGSVTVRLPQGTEQVDLVAIVRAIDEAGVAVAQLQQHAPSLDDVFLAKTGRSLEGAGDEAPAEDSEEVAAQGSGA